MSNPGNLPRSEQVEERILKMRKRGEDEPFQRFCVGLLRNCGYELNESNAATGDLGCDAVGHTPENKPCFVAVSYKATQRKVLEDVKRWKEAGFYPIAKVMIFMTADNPTSKSIKKWQDAVQREHKIALEVWGLPTVIGRSITEQLWGSTVSELQIAPPPTAFPISIHVEYPQISASEEAAVLNPAADLSRVAEGGSQKPDDQSARAPSQVYLSSMSDATLRWGLVDADRMRCIFKLNLIFFDQIVLSAPAILRNHVLFEDSQENKEEFAKIFGQGIFRPMLLRKEGLDQHDSDRDKFKAVATELTRYAGSALSEGLDPILMTGKNPRPEQFLEFAESDVFVDVTCTNTAPDFRYELWMDLSKAVKSLGEKGAQWLQEKNIQKDDLDRMLLWLEKPRESDGWHWKPEELRVRDIYNFRLRMLPNSATARLLSILAFIMQEVRTVPPGLTFGSNKPTMAVHGLVFARPERAVRRFWQRYVSSQLLNLSYRDVLYIRECEALVKLRRELKSLRRRLHEEPEGVRGGQQLEYALGDAEKFIRSVLVVRTPLLQQGDISGALPPSHIQGRPGCILSIEAIQEQTDILYDPLSGEVCDYSPP